MKSIVIVGFGISTLCFLLYLYDKDLIKNLDIIILEKNLYPCYSSLKYNINSNSTLKSLLSIFSNKVFEKVINRIYEEYDEDKYVSLMEYNGMIMELSEIFVNELKGYKNIKINFDYEVKSVRGVKDGYMINENMIVEKIIMATGGGQTEDYIYELDSDNVLNGVRDKIIIPHNLFERKELLKFENKNVLISGSSHSIMSIIDMILTNEIKYKSIIVYNRSKIKVFYYNKEECVLIGDKYDEDDVCSDTGFINRFDGLRERSKDIYMNIDKYSNISFTNEYSKIDFNNIDYIIPCWGYYKNLPLIDNSYSYNIDSTNNFELIFDGNIKSNIYLLGIMSKPKIQHTQKSFKKSIDGVWYYYNIISKNLYNVL